MVSDQEIARGVVELLSVPQNGGVSSLNDVVQQLSSKLGLDLSSKSDFIAHQINLLRQFTPPPPPLTPSFQNDRFALPNNPHFLQHFYYQQQQQQLLLQQQQQQQQQQGLPSPFTLHFGGYQSHVPPPQNHVPSLQPHVTTQQPHVTYDFQQQQHVASPPVVKNVAPTPKASKDSSQTGTKRKGGSGGLNKLCGVSPELQAIVGEATMSRTEIVRQLWAYIRKNNLQDPSNKRKIVCDEALRAVLETDITDMFKMNKLLSKHILSLGPTKGPVPPKRQKLDAESGSLLADDVAAAETAKSVETSVGESLVVISDALASFLGTTKREMLASEAIQRVCEYVKVNGLEDPSSLIVICNEKLRELLGCERISMLEINETLARHHLPQSS